MDRRRMSYPKNVRTLCAAVVAAVILIGAAGCGERMAQLEANQMRLQGLVEANAMQITEVVTSAERNQEQLQAAILSLRGTTEQLSAEMRQVAQAHTSLQDTVAAQNRDALGRVAAVEDGHELLTTRVEQTESANRQLAADLAAMRARQAELAGLIESNQKSVVARLAAMDSNRTQLQADLGDVRVMTERLAADVAVVADAQAKLETGMRDQIAGQAASLATVREDHHTQTEVLAGRVEQLAATADAARGAVARLEQAIAADNEQLVQLVQSIDQTRTQIAAIADGRKAHPEVTATMLEQQQADMQARLQQLQAGMEAMVRDVREDMERLQQDMARAREADRPE